MNATQVSAVMLALAVLAAPAPPRRRLALPASKRGISGRRWAPLAAACLPVFAVAVQPALALASLIAATAIAARIRRRGRERRRRVEGQMLAGALEVVVGELKVGAHPLSAFAIAGAEDGGRVGRSLRAVATRAQMGADVAEGLRLVAADSAVAAYWNRLAVFWQLAAEHGLAMSDLMRAAHRDIVDRQRFADRMRASLAGARATAAILAALPVVGVLLGQLIGAQPLRFLLGGGAGGALLVIGVGLICAGLVWADRIVDRLVA